MKYINILMCGPRAAGKSTIGFALAQKLGWELIEMDLVIAERADKPIIEITEHGTNWQKFREMETCLLQELLTKRNVVISAGGGIGVNNHINKKTNKTFGEEQKEILDGINTTLIILLTAKEEIIAERIGVDEQNTKEIQRPLLHEKQAQENKGKDSSQKEIISSIIEDSLKMSKIREPLYKALTDYIIDTSTRDRNEIVQEIITILNKQQ